MRPKDIGTRAESAVVAAAVEAGIVAQRVALAGSGDQGDVWLRHGRVVIEVKGGKAAATASHNQIVQWWLEAEREAGRVLQCDMAVLVVKRQGKGQARDWRAFTTIADYTGLIGEQMVSDRLIEMPFGWLLDDIAEVI